MLPPAKQTENQANKATTTNGTFFGGGSNTPFFQAKLTVNQPGDEHEREADAVADQVMRMKDGDASIVQRMPLTPVNDIMRKCTGCEEKEKEGVQRKETVGGDASGKTAPSAVSDVLSSGGGQMIDSGTKQFMESRFGQDFSQVRIHTDARAAESASAIQARAYTSGRDVVFGSGEYQSGSEEGRRLLAHELVHVGQQGGGRGIKRKGLDVETERLQNPKAAAFVSTSYMTSFKESLGKIKKLRDANTVIRQQAEALWNTNHPDTPGSSVDDRPLYWTRLAAVKEIEQWSPRFWGLNRKKRDGMKQLFESTSRGQNNMIFKEKAGIKKILISGFDPFSLDKDIEKSNPTGSIALSLDGMKIEKDGVQGEIQSTVFPNRYEAFDAGIVEQAFQPFLSGDQSIDMIMGIGMGIGKDYEIEEVAGKRRSFKTLDNLGIQGMPGTDPVAFPGVSEDAPEFLPTALLETTMKSMRGAVGRSSALKSETDCKKRGGRTSSIDSPGSTAVEGSGGGFFCNEIMYRTLMLRNNLGASVPVGFLHTPLLSEVFTSDKIRTEVIKILTEALPTLSQSASKTE